MNPNDVVITGIGIVSSLGLGAQAHWDALSSQSLQPSLDTERFAPYTVHPLPEIDWSLQIPKRGDQRQMETWQRLGTYAAGLALDDSGIKDDTELCSTMDMIVAAGGGERDVEVDQGILDASLARNDHDVLLNEKLTTELRPTLFLAQLSNLLAGNISIVHKVTGSSRTFMGEEGSGVAAIETAAARIRSGQSTHILVGAAFQTEHPDMLLGYELGAFLDRNGWSPLWERAEREQAEQQGGGVLTGSGACFLVLESRAHAEARGCRAYATIETIVSARARRANGELADTIEHLLEQASGSRDIPLVVSGASGAHASTSVEKAVLAKQEGLAVRGFTNLTGHMKEVQFPFAIGLAALAIRNGKAYPPFDPRSETPTDAQPRAVLATAVGYNCYEGIGLVTEA